MSECGKGKLIIEYTAESYGGGEVCTCIYVVRYTHIAHGTIL